MNTDKKDKMFEKLILRKCLFFGILAFLVIATYLVTIHNIKNIPPTQEEIVKSLNSNKCLKILLPQILNNIKKPLTRFQLKNAQGICNQRMRQEQIKYNEN